MRWISACSLCLCPQLTLSSCSCHTTHLFIRYCHALNLHISVNILIEDCCVQLIMEARLRSFIPDAAIELDMKHFAWTETKTPVTVREVMFNIHNNWCTNSKLRLFFWRGLWQLNAGQFILQVSLPLQWLCIQETLLMINFIFMELFTNKFTIFGGKSFYFAPSLRFFWSFEISWGECVLWSCIPVCCASCSAVTGEPFIKSSRLPRRSLAAHCSLWRTYLALTASVE